MAKRRTKTSRPQTEAARAREEHWRAILDEQKTSRLGPTAFCREKKISSHAYFWWKREIRVRAGGTETTATEDIDREAAPGAGAHHRRSGERELRDRSLGTPRGEGAQGIR